MNSQTINNRYVLAYMFLLFLGFAFARSTGYPDAASLLVKRGPLLLSGLFLLLIALPIIWIVVVPSRTAYFFGASPALGMFPSVPHLPFLQEVTHLMVFVAIASLWRALPPSFRRLDSRLWIYFAFVAIAVASVIVNFAIHGSLWQLKLGVSNLLMLSAFGVYLLLLHQNCTDRRGMFVEMLNGFMHSAFWATGIGLATIVLLFVIPYSSGTNQIGNDAIFGLAYFDRMQLLFVGPTFAGVFFVVAMGFAISLAAGKKGSSKLLIIAFLQFAPWLIMASGSRVGRICLIVMMVVCLVQKPLRQTALLALPSSLLALAIGLEFQSLPSAVKYFVGLFFPKILDPEQFAPLSLAGRFFDGGERTVLVQSASNFFANSSILNWVLGHGFGVAGFRTASFPSPHQQPMDLLIEVGIFGLLAYYALLTSFVLHAYKAKLTELYFAPAFAPILYACFACLMVLSLAYEIGNRGITLVLLSMIFLWPSVNTQFPLSEQSKP